MYSIDFSGYNMDGPPSEVVTVIEGGGFIAAPLGGWGKREPWSERLI